MVVGARSYSAAHLGTTVVVDPRSYSAAHLGTLGLIRVSFARPPSAPWLFSLMAAATPTQDSSSEVAGLGFGAGGSDGTAEGLDQVAGQGDTDVVVAEAMLISGGRLARPQYVPVESNDFGRFVPIARRALWISQVVAGKSYSRCTVPLGDLFTTLSDLCLSSGLPDDDPVALDLEPDTRLPKRPNDRVSLRSWKHSLDSMTKPWTVVLDLGEVYDKLREMLPAGLPAGTGAGEVDLQLPSSRNPFRGMRAKLHCTRKVSGRGRVAVSMAVAVEHLKAFIVFLGEWAQLHLKTTAQLFEENDPPETPSKASRPRREAAARKQGRCE